jgi:hypothetical protein
MESADCLTLVMPLQARSGLTPDDFYEYWLNAHVTLPARFPGISSIFLHSTSFDDVAWPRLPGVSHRPPPEDDFWGVPEATFVTLEGLADFQAASKVQMDDGINFLQEMIAYRSIADATQTAADRTGLPAAHCSAVHVARDSRCITTKYQGTITLAGVRGVAVADVIRRLGAASQLDDEVSALFLPEPSTVLV